MGLDSVELVIETEAHFQIEISDDEAEAVQTVGQLRDLVCRKLVAKGERANPDIILREVVDMTSRITAIDKSKIKETDDFVKDLRLD